MQSPSKAFSFGRTPQLAVGFFTAYNDDHIGGFKR
jgi:hypothetical protein